MGIPDPARRLKDYPHQLSGGMRQRALLALALSCEPRLLIADEPTTALDVTVQAQILDLLRSLQRRLGMAVVFVTHDLGVVADLCSRVVVMGQVVEEAPVRGLFARPRHPCTAGLLAAIPQRGVESERLASIPGVVPPPTAVPTGCRFHLPLPMRSRPARPPPSTPPMRRPPHRPVPAPRRAHARGNRAGGDMSAIVEGAGWSSTSRSTAGSCGERSATCAVDGVDLVVEEGRTLGLVGESGSGKSTVGQVLLRLLPPTAGTVVFDGDIRVAARRRLRPLRQGDAARVPGPVLLVRPASATIADSLAEPMKTYLDLDAVGRTEIARLLTTVRLNPTTATATRASSRAASSSASPSPPRWPSRRSCSCSTSR